MASVIKIMTEWRLGSILKDLTVREVVFQILILILCYVVVSQDTIGLSKTASYRNV